MNTFNVAQKEYNENKYLLNGISNECVKQRVDSNLKWYITQAVKAKKWYYIFSATTIIAPIVSSIIIIIFSEDTLKNIISALVLAFSTIAASFLNLFDVKTKWALYRNQAEEIKRLLIKHSVENDKTDTELLKAIEESIQDTDKKWTDKLTKE